MLSLTGQVLISSPLCSGHFNAFEEPPYYYSLEEGALEVDTVGEDAFEETLSINFIEVDTPTRKATTMEEEWVNWAEEVEMLNAFEEEIVEKKAVVRKKPAKKVERRKVTIKKETSYPGLIRLGSYLAMREGKEGMKKLQKDGVKTEEQVEEQLAQKYLEEMMKQPGVCKNPEGEKFQTFDVEALEEGALQRLICGWESGPKIVSVKEGGKTLPYVSLLAMGPHSPYIIGQDVSKEQSKQDTGSDLFRGVEKEVIIY